MIDKEWYRAMLRHIVALGTRTASDLSCHYCQAQPGEWCEYDCGSPWPVLHPANVPLTHGDAP